VIRFVRRFATMLAKVKGERSKERHDANGREGRRVAVGPSLPFDVFPLPFSLSRLTSLAITLVTCAAALVVAASAAQPAAPRFPGTATTVTVNRVDGRVAVMQGSTLSVYPTVEAPAPAASFEIPGSNPAVVEFRGNQILYSTHGVNEMPVVLVAVSAEGRERLAWPNSGISELFPTESSRLTLDGKGVFGFLPLDAEARAFFGMANDIPAGAGIAATYRFAGEKLLARGSEAFAGIVALSPDDMLLTLKGGGLMRVRPPGAAGWKREGKGGEWRVVDVDPKAGIVVAVDAAGAAVATGLEKGDPRWRVDVAGARVLDCRTLGDGRALVLADGKERSASVIDPATGRTTGSGLAEAAGRQGLAQVYFDWLANARSLAELVEVTMPQGPVWLIRGPDGWYAARSLQ
jgi:hypothetical protein